MRARAENMHDERGGFFSCVLFPPLRLALLFKPLNTSVSLLLTTKDVSFLVARSKERRMYSQATHSFVYVKSPLCLGHPTIFHFV